MSNDLGPSVARILAFLMIDGMGPDATNEDKTVRLNACGFPNAEISELLGIPIGSVNQNLYTARKKLKKPAKKTVAKKPVPKKMVAKKTTGPRD